MSRKTPWAVVAALVAVSLFGLVGCGQDDDPAAPADGRLGVLTAPETLTTPWTVTGPDGFQASGVGTRDLSGLAPGTYELTWGAVEGWVRPWPHVVSVDVGGEDTPFVSGEYRENVPSTVVLEGDADAAGAAWTLRGSEGLVRRGTGTAVLTDVDAGRYELTWTTPSGWLNTGPTRQVGTVFGDELTFTAGFVADVDLPAGFEYVPAGTFRMGSPEDEWGRQMDETPHEVTLTNDLMVAAREITASRFANLATWAVDQGHARFDSLFTNPDTTFFGPDTTYVEPDSTIVIEPPFYVVAYDTTITLFDSLASGDVPLIQPALSNMFITEARDSLKTETPGLPAVGLNFFGAAAYCDWLNLQEGLPLAYDHDTWLPAAGAPADAAGYRLPTEAEWEYAARAGETDAFTTGPVVNPICDDPNLMLVGWHCDGAVREVARKQANGWGLYDMHGNVWEWCLDGWVEYPEEPVTDPFFPRVEGILQPDGTPPAGVQDEVAELAAKVNALVNVVRGGSALDFAIHCRSANRAGHDTYWGNSRLGFRPVRTMPAGER